MAFVAVKVERLDHYRETSYKITYKYGIYRDGFNHINVGKWYYTFVIILIRIFFPKNIFIGTVIELLCCGYSMMFQSSYLRSLREKYIVYSSMIDVLMWLMFQYCIFWSGWCLKAVDVWGPSENIAHQHWSLWVREKIY